MDKLEKSLKVSQTVGGTFIGIGIITVVVCLLLK